MSSSSSGGTGHLPIVNSTTTFTTRIIQASAEAGGVAAPCALLSNFYRQAHFASLRYPFSAFGYPFLAFGYPFLVLDIRSFIKNT